MVLFLESFLEFSGRVKHRDSWAHTNPTEELFSSLPLCFGHGQLLWLAVVIYHYRQIIFAIIGREALVSEFTLLWIFRFAGLLAFTRGKTWVSQVLRALLSHQSFRIWGSRMLSTVHSPVWSYNGVLPEQLSTGRTLCWAPLKAEVIGLFIKVKILGILMVSFMISSKTPKFGSSDARRVLCRDENLVDEVPMEQWEVNKAYREW